MLCPQGIGRVRLLLPICLIALFVHPFAPVRAGDEYHAPLRVGILADSRITELSGMVPVSGHQNHFWIHNDSKNSPRLYAVHQNGTVIAEARISGVANTDWEDIACGPGPVAERNYLYIADTGNNDLGRQTLSIFRLPEPELPHLAPGQILTVGSPEEVRFNYPDGTFDAEALIVHPMSGELYILTKVGGTAGIYRLPRWDPSKVQTLVLIGGISTTTRITAADVSRDGQRVLIRTLARVFEFRLPEGEPFERIFSQPRRRLPSTTVETKSESICYDHTDRDYITSNEGSSPPVHRTYRREPQPFCEFNLEVGSPLRYIRGDLLSESDGEDPSSVNIADSVLLVDALRGEVELDCQDRGDVDDDGVLGIDDLGSLLGSLVRGESLPAPFRARDLDPTTDELPCLDENRQRLVEAGEVWHYWHDDVPPQPGWREIDHDTSAWSEGPGGVGFGPTDLGTRLGGSPSASHTLYARRQFTVLEPELLDHLVLEIDYNDGFVAYIDGLEVARRGLGPTGYSVPAELPARLHRGGVAEDIHLCPESLRPGVNVLALEIHKNSTTDSSLFFRAGLRGFTLAKSSSPPPGPPERAGRLYMTSGEVLGLGDRGVIQVRLETPQPIRGYTLYVDYDPSQLQLTSARASADLQDKVREESFINNLSGRLAHAMVVDPDALPDGVGTPDEVLDLVDLSYEVVGGPGKTRLAFLERTGTFALGNLLVGQGPRSLVPETEDFTAEISEVAPPRIESFFANEGRAGRRFFIFGRRFDAPETSVRVCGRETTSRLLADGATLEVEAPPCDTAGPAPVEVCNDAGCDIEEEGFFYEGSGLEWIRGDANGDGRVDISDPIALLGRLFLGTAATPTCEQAFDGNGDGRVDVSDAIFVLSFLFQGDVEIQPPYPEPADCP